MAGIPWYRKATVQAALVLGLLGVVAVLVDKLGTGLLQHSGFHEAERQSPLTAAHSQDVLPAEFLSASEFWIPDTLAEDDFHHYELHEWTFNIENGIDGEYIAHLRGVNVSGRPTTFLPHKISGDNAVSFRLLQARVTDNLCGRIQGVTQSDLIYDYPYRKAFRVPFSEPLPTGGRFDVTVTNRWPGTFARAEEFVFFCFSHYKQGVDKVVARVKLPETPSRYHVYLWHDEDAPLQPLANENISFDEQTGHLIWRKEKPQLGPIYVIRFWSS